MSSRKRNVRKYRGPSRYVDPRRAPGPRRQGPDIGVVLAAGGTVIVVLLLIFASILQGGGTTTTPAATTGSSNNPAAPPVSNPAQATSAAATSAEAAFATRTANLPTISAQDALNLYNANNARIIDVRVAGVYSTSHIKSAPNIPYTEAQQRLGEFPKSGNIIVYCQ